MTWEAWWHIAIIILSISQILAWLRIERIERDYAALLQRLREHEHHT